MSCINHIFLSAMTFLYTHLLLCPRQGRRINFNISTHCIVKVFLEKLKISLEFFLMKPGETQSLILKSEQIFYFVFSLRLVTLSSVHKLTFTTYTKVGPLGSFLSIINPSFKYYYSSGSLCRLYLNLSFDLNNYTNVTYFLKTTLVFAPISYCN